MDLSWVVFINDQIKFSCRKNILLSSISFTNFHVIEKFLLNISIFKFQIKFCNKRLRVNYLKNNIYYKYAFF